MVPQCMACTWMVGLEVMYIGCWYRYAVGARPLLLFEPALLSAAAGAHPSLGSCGMLLGPGHNSRGSCCPRASASIAPSDAAAAPTPTVFLTTKDEDTIAAIVTGEGSLPAAGPHDGWT